MPKRLFLLFALFIFSLACAHGQTKRIAVLPFEGDGLSAADARALTLFFETALQNTGLCEIVEQNKVDAILKSHQFVLADFNDPAKAVAIGKLVPANTIVLGAAGKLGGKPYINVKMIELSSGTVVGASNATAASVDALAAKMDALAAGMLGESSSDPPPFAPLVPTAPPGSSPPFHIQRSRLALFESGPGIPPMESREYAITFFTEKTRFINWELFLQFDPPVAATSDYPLEAAYLRPDGSVQGSVQYMSAHIEAGWTWFRIENGLGAPNVNNWNPGAYSLQITLAGMLVGHTTFVVR